MSPGADCAGDWVGAARAIQSDTWGRIESQFVDNAADDWQPSRSPSPSSTEKIAYSSNIDGDYDIYVMDADGGNVVQVTDNNAADDETPSWSPDGSQIAYTSNLDGGDKEIYVIDVDGCNVLQLTDNNAADDWDPDWSPSVYGPINDAPTATV